MHRFNQLNDTQQTGQQFWDRSQKQTNLSHYLEEQNPQLQNDQCKMRKAIRAYFDSRPFSTIQDDKSKKNNSSCSNSYSNDNSDIITMHSQNYHQLANESDLEYDEQLSQLLKVPIIQDANLQNSKQYIPKQSFDILQKAYIELQQKYFNVREEIKENQNQLCSLLSELKSQQQNNAQLSNCSQLSEQSISSKLEEKFTSQINKAFRIMYENLKEESEKIIQQKDKQIQDLKEQTEQLSKVNELLIQQNEQKENALMDIIQYYGILKQQIESIKQERELNQESPSLVVTQRNQNIKQAFDQMNNTNSSFQVLQEQTENAYSIPSFSSSNSKNITDSIKKSDLQFYSKNGNNQSYQLNPGFSFAIKSQGCQQESEKKSKEENQSNKENSQNSITKHEQKQNNDKKQITKQYETFKTEECDKNEELIYLENQQKIQVLTQKDLNQQQDKQLNQQSDAQYYFDDQSETVFEDVQGQSLYDQQFISNQQNQKMQQFGEENYISNDISAQFNNQMSNPQQRDCKYQIQSNSTPNKQFRQLNDYLHSHEINFEQEQQEIQMIKQKVKKCNRLNMLSKLKKEVFQEGLKTALIPSSIQTNRKSSTTPRKLISSINSRGGDQILSTSRNRSFKETNQKHIDISQIDDPIQRGFMIIENLYHSIERKFQKQEQV
ncbi:hypothetical protein TTHERM_00151840 (macronuclear) [Tetrahymena thermophila SB210]|uniref:Uncharacterized protein n=1 Tax=Tetrahymena thermophila (strain SB210) TaxID=312017 RepID=I7M9F2_TETTS|nr:hypothetical protein TTHERM_00151840 [Tetrahymena thermophila SB210]EAS01471.2 hypothetical protein TTHERM_00151840 [Tetrahymena thermophila SB210]|eukprot:XP_001021717.2 hypothetical protein TTHERM_00151840 [Tetrahymena thermophila SB210]